MSTGLKQSRKKADNSNSDKNSSEDERDEIKSYEDENSSDNKLKKRGSSRSNSVYKERRNS
jgi:hypothetical protein